MKRVHPVTYVCILAMRHPHKASAEWDENQIDLPDDFEGHAPALVECLRRVRQLPDLAFAPPPHPVGSAHRTIGRTYDLL
jgi:hypothetical protein